MDPKNFQKKNKKAKANPLNPGPPRLPNVGNSEKECRDTLLDKLIKLKEYGVIKHSICPNLNEFEVLEFYGDSVLYERISSFIMHTRRFMNPHLMTTLRSFIVQNRNLALCYDTLGIQTLLVNPPAEMPFKEKADVIEAIIGELAEAADEEGLQHAQASKTLSEVLTYICYLGEKTYFTNLSLAEEQKKDQPQSPLLVTPHTTATPSHTPAKDRSMSPRKNSYPPQSPTKKNGNPLPGTTTPVVNLPSVSNVMATAESTLESTNSKKKTPLMINGQPTLLLTRGTQPVAAQTPAHPVNPTQNLLIPTQRSESQSGPMFYTPTSRSAPSSFGPVDSSAQVTHSPVIEYRSNGAAPTEPSSWSTDSRADNNTTSQPHNKNNGNVNQNEGNSTQNRLLLANQTQVGGRQIFEYREIKV
jgi:dsRNA-specific ribonuclease